MSWTIKAAEDAEIDAHLATLKKGDQVEVLQDLDLDVGTADAMSALYASLSVIVASSWSAFFSRGNLSG